MELETIIKVVIGIGIGIATSVIHKRKGYSPVAGFCWGFFFSVIGLLVVLLEKDKAELDAKYEGKKQLSVFAWIVIFTVITIAIVAILAMLS